MPPKYKVVHHFENVPVELINESVIEALKKTNFELASNTGFFIDAIKKLGFTFMSFFAWSKPKINLAILITKTGRLTISSTYDYNSMFGIAMNDLGQQEKHISVLLDEIRYLVVQNRSPKNYNTLNFEKSTTNINKDIKWRE